MQDFLRNTVFLLFPMPLKLFTLKFLRCFGVDLDLALDALIITFACAVVSQTN